LTGSDEIIAPMESPATDEGQEEHARLRHTIVFYGDARQVSAGFALAVHAMEAHANLLDHECAESQSGLPS
jgi:hypothetical protein